MERFRKDEDLYKIELKERKKEAIRVLEDFYFYKGIAVPSLVKNSIKACKRVEKIDAIRRECIDEILKEWKNDSLQTC